MITILQALVVILAIYTGVRMRGIGLGLMGAIGTLVLIFVFGLEPGKAPIDVMLIIASVVVCAAAMQAAGGIQFLIKVAEKILRSNPKFITFLGPITTYFFTLFAGTSHIIYGLLPVISEISIYNKTRPERPMTMSVIASHLAITASPVSAATAALAAILAPSGLGLREIFFICIPSTLLGSIVGVLFMWNKGKNWNEDPNLLSFQTEHLKNEQIVLKASKQTMLSVMLFAMAVIAVSFFGLFPEFLPKFVTETGELATLKVSTLIQVVMFATAGIITLTTQISSKALTDSPVFKTGMEAMISIFGVVWMTDTFLLSNMGIIKGLLSQVVEQYPFMFVGALLIFSAIIFSQASTTKALMPLGLALGIPAPFLIAMFPAVNGDFIIPGYPTVLAAANFDRTGTTRFGKYLLNHSFMLPGLVSVGATVVFGYLISRFI